MTNANNYLWALSHMNSDFSPKFIVEVGSKDCLDAIHLSQHFKCPVLSFEANPEQFEICLENLKQHKSLDVKVRNEALSDVNGNLPFWKIDKSKYGNTGASSLFKIDFKNRPKDDIDLNHEDIQEAIQVQARRWDSYSLPTPNLLALDVEGSELKVLKGFGSTLSEVKYIVLEVSPVSTFIGGCKFKDIRKFLNLNDFRYVASDAFGRGYVNLIVGLIKMWVKSRLKKPFGKAPSRGFFNVIYVNKHI